MNNIRGLEELQGISSIDQAKAILEAQGYSVIRYNSWAISFCEQAEANSRYRREILFTITSGIDEEAINQKTVYGYSFRRHFVIRESTNNPNAVSKIFVSSPQSLDREAHWMWPRRVKDNFNDAPVILCGTKPDHKGDGKFIDYKILDYGGNIQEIKPSEYKTEFPVSMYIDRYLYVAYQDLPMMLFKKQTIKKKIKTADVQTYERKFIMGEPIGQRNKNKTLDKVVIPKEIKNIDKRAFEGTSIEKVKYKLRKIVMEPTADGQYIIRYVVLSGPRDGDILCDFFNFEKLMVAYNSQATRKIITFELVAMYAQHNKVEYMDMAESMRSYYRPEDAKISQRIRHTVNLELLDKIIGNFDPMI